MPRIKKIVRKNGNYRRTTTYSSTGKVTESFSNHPTKSSPHTTVSYSNGKMRTTRTTKLGGGWTDISTKTTTLVGKSRNRRSKSNDDINLPLILCIGILLFLVYLMPSIAPYIIGTAVVIGILIFLFSIIHYIVWGGIILFVIWVISLFA